jgi:hypothetical protein
LLAPRGSTLGALDRPPPSASLPPRRPIPAPLVARPSALVARPIPATDPRHTAALRRAVPVPPPIGRQPRRPYRPWAARGRAPGPRAVPQRPGAEHRFPRTTAPAPRRIPRLTPARGLFEHGPGGPTDWTPGCRPPPPAIRPGHRAARATRSPAACQVAKTTSFARRKRRRPASSEAGLQKKPRQRPTLPQNCSCSTIGPGELNFRVRDGNGCGLSGVATGKNMAKHEQCEMTGEPSRFVWVARAPGGHLRLCCVDV